MAHAKDIEVGALYRKIGPGQPVWRVDSMIRHAPLPHVKLMLLDSQVTQMTISVVTLNDPRFFERLPPR